MAAQTTTPPHIWTSTAAGHLAQRVVRDEYAYTPHPAFAEDVVDKTIQCAESSHPLDRLFAARCAETPMSAIYMMRGDRDADVRAAVERRIAWESDSDE